MIKISSNTLFIKKKKGNVQGLSIRYEYTSPYWRSGHLHVFLSQTPAGNLKGHSLQLITLNFDLYQR
jgi:hypothetical protein